MWQQKLVFVSLSFERSRDFVILDVRAQTRERERASPSAARPFGLFAASFREQKLTFYKVQLVLFFFIGSCFWSSV